MCLDFFLLSFQSEMALADADRMSDAVCLTRTEQSLRTLQNKILYLDSIARSLLACPVAVHLEEGGRPAALSEQARVQGGAAAAAGDGCFDSRWAGPRPGLVPSV